MPSGSICFADWHVSCHAAARFTIAVTVESDDMLPGGFQVAQCGIFLVVLICLCRETDKSSDGGYV